MVPTSAYGTAYSYTQPGLLISWKASWVYSEKFAFRILNFFKMSISEPVFFLIDPYSAFYALFAANLVSHNSVFLHRPKKTERPRWTECHAAMSVGGCWYFLEKCWKTGGKRTRCPRQPIVDMDVDCRRPRHDENYSSLFVENSHPETRHQGVMFRSPWAFVDLLN